MGEKIKVTRDICNTIKDKRITKGLTQKLVADQSKINYDSYKRIENFQTKNIERDKLKRITRVLDINDNFWLPNNAKMTAIRIPVDDYNYLLSLKESKDFDSITETILHCITEYKTNSQLLSCKDDVEDIIASALNKSYEKMINVLKNTIQNHEKILEKLSNSGVDVKRYENEVIEESRKRLHANAY
ncbi:MULTISPECIES: helix-turn-helix transcriptional regulator [unclassified Breznakia]|uniref:helix-turn-helix domain-containing protein n=1 Tax=unclassified Breznakia TaxID=2623764 RepID=UPI0024750DE9|nr:MULTISPECIES: helix-turn-helix transcriptional regulator [unclassified Breznakia]MDH6367397.1 transcriptional regulator with XRE-family HTH domain [Breznakia sp. PH1-1]MDH6403929.1 transcriptional regulator with XRE-family HTH domain [Breznakia sp. PF1-11]MDH6411638.1 transcriptional regulator with XRE-family HTH domain [Breznakia sp. PFB1-11]MDH6414564.1 transcriptional regulator with XRE-family HTH domain [Breznakia sp. PFB1-14]MDH6418670.1 transcriptional regulator with XRE-family HTH do